MEASQRALFRSFNVTLVIPMPAVGEFVLVIGIQAAVGDETTVTESVFIKVVPVPSAFVAVRVTL